jgi:hypothetical protein
VASRVQVEEEIRLSGRLRQLTHMLGVTMKLARGARTEGELSGEVLDFMEALNSFLIEGKAAAGAIRGPPMR